jgi:acetyl esterase/lipase
MTRVRACNCVMDRTVSLIVASILVLASCVGGDDAEPAADPTAAPASTTSTPTTTTSAASDSSAVTSPPTSDLPIEPVVHPAAGDLAYATASQMQRLDVYTPEAGILPHPVVVIIHGGGWTMGDKRGELPLAAVPGFLALGYAVASVNYRLAPDAVFPAQLLDVKAAIRYLRAEAPALGLDPDRIAVVGESAGAHLAALLGTTAGVAEFDDPSLGNPGVSSAVQAVIDFYGPSDLTTSDEQRALNSPCPTEPDPNIALLLGAPPSEAPDLAAAASPTTYLRPGQDVPPFFIAHGDADCVVPHQQSIELDAAIEAVAPGRSELTIVPGSGHYLDFDFETVNAALTAFLGATVGAP